MTAAEIEQNTMDDEEDAQRYGKLWDHQAVSEPMDPVDSIRQGPGGSTSCTANSSPPSQPVGQGKRQRPSGGARLRQQHSYGKLELGQDMEWDSPPFSDLHEDAWA